MTTPTKVAVLGSGVIGASWTALFLAHGKDVAVYDPSPSMREDVLAYIDNARPTLQKLGFSKNGKLTFFDNVIDAVGEVEFIQENVPENINIKKEIFQQIEPHLLPHCVVASSASGLMVKEMQAAWKNPSRFILGHPFNPPHLIPLVELLGNEKTADGVIDIADSFYRSVGKVTIRLYKEIPGHAANRLQAALWREAIYLVTEGVASVEDVDKAVRAGPGLRWAAMGPHKLFHLGAGAGGMREFCRRYEPSFSRWWSTLGAPILDEPTIEKIASGIDISNTEEESKKRDALITDILQAKMRHEE